MKFHIELMCKLVFVLGAYGKYKLLGRLLSQHISIIPKTLKFLKCYKELG